MDGILKAKPSVAHKCRSKPQLEIRTRTHANGKVCSPSPKTGDASDATTVRDDWHCYAPAVRRPTRKSERMLRANCRAGAKRLAVSDISKITRRSVLLGAAGVAVSALAGERDRAGSAPPGAVPDRDVGLLDLSAVQAVKCMASGELAAERYAEALLARCRDQQALNAFITSIRNAFSRPRVRPIAAAPRAPPSELCTACRSRSTTA